MYGCKEIIFFSGYKVPNTKLSGSICPKHNVGLSWASALRFDNRVHTRLEMFDNSVHTRMKEIGSRDIKSSRSTQLKGTRNGPRSTFELSTRNHFAGSLNGPSLLRRGTWPGSGASGPIRAEETSNEKGSKGKAGKRNPGGMRIDSAAATLTHSSRVAIRSAAASPPVVPRRCAIVPDCQCQVPTIPPALMGIVCSRVPCGHPSQATARIGPWTQQIKLE